MQTDVVAYAGIVVGVVISVILPVLAAYVRANFKQQAAVIDFKRYLALLAFAAVAGVIVFAFSPVQLDFRGAVLAGYTWEATLEKIAK